MANNIYDISDWGGQPSYTKNDIVKNLGYYYYALRDHVAPASFDIDQLLNWGGRASDNNNDIKPNFIWIPSYSSPVNNTPTVKKTQFGDGYAQRMRDGINNVLLELDLAFDERYLQEASAIAHFLQVREAVESFLYVPPPPYAKRKRFICETWSFVSNFYNNNSIKAKFIEVAN